MHHNKATGVWRTAWVCRPAPDAIRSFPFGCVEVAWEGAVLWFLVIAGMEGLRPFVSAPVCQASPAHACVVPRRTPIRSYCIVLIAVGRGVLRSDCGLAVGVEN